MTSTELQLCDILGGLFKLSARRGIGSAEFIKVFMKSDTAKALDPTYNRMQWAGEEYLLEEVIDEARDRFEKPGDVYSEELIFWIGYIYWYWPYVAGESSKEIIKLATVKVIKKNNEWLYMMTPEEVIRMMRRWYRRKCSK